MSDLAESALNCSLDVKMRALSDIWSLIDYGAEGFLVYGLLLTMAVFLLFLANRVGRRAAVVGLLVIFGIANALGLVWLGGFAGWWSIAYLALVLGAAGLPVLVIARGKWAILCLVVGPLVATLAAPVLLWIMMCSTQSCY